MKKVKNFLKKKNLLGIANSLALAMVAMSAQTCCYWFYHQPQFPTEADQFRKFK